VRLISTKGRTSRLLSKYGLSVEDFARMFHEQGGKCAICSCDLSAEAQKENTANVDHCHATGRVRGLLCMFCNAEIGYLRDSAASAERAASYLRGSTEPRALTRCQGDTPRCTGGYLRVRAALACFPTENRFT
jgi:hypothetical protein